jgi:hypothetical protein
VQNAEQQPTSIFKKILEKRVTEDVFKPMDRLYIEFNKDRFNGIHIDIDTDPELYKFIQAIQNGSHKFDDYPHEEIEYYASRIYELRKDNSNNTPG